MKKFLIYIFAMLFLGACANLNKTSDLNKIKNNNDVLILLLDISGSMTESDSKGDLKINAAKMAIKDISLKLDGDKVNVGLFSFPKHSCYGINTVVPLSNNDPNALVRQSRDIIPNGSTPLAGALKYISDITKQLHQKISIILLSDGMETCGGDPLKVVKEFEERNISLSVIGYAVDEETKNELEKLVVGSGKYFEAKDGYGLMDSVNKATSSLNINKQGWENGIYNFRISFDISKAIIKPEFQQNIKDFANYLKNNDYKVEIQGHTDSVGSASSNKNLSQKRANSVRKAIISEGIEAKRIVAKGYGESKPIATNDTKNGRFKNRRVEAHILSN